jgi:coproporphyrinogen III oxidase
MIPQQRDEIVDFLRQLQHHICTALVKLDGEAAFRHDDWQHHSGGGGQTRVIEGGRVFERGAVNVSAVEGRLPKSVGGRGDNIGQNFFACGLSLVLHPQNPFVPAVHCNFRYFECFDEQGVRQDRWFGGGADLTPVYPELEDVQHFHRTLQRACDGVVPGSYQRFKAQCDEYFYLPHRQETRGVGGVFFDYLRDEPGHDWNTQATLWHACALGFLPAYLPIAERQVQREYGEQHKQWQLLRRGRYAEFNLAFDRGTRFGLETGGRTESILLSLPPQVVWAYNHQPAPGSAEARLAWFLQGRDWLGISEQEQ